MSFSSIRYLLKEGFRNVWANRMMSLASIGVLVSCLILTGAAYLFSLNINTMMSSLDSNNQIKVILEDSVDDLEAGTIGGQLKAISNIEDCQFITKQDAFEELKQTISEEDLATFTDLDPNDFLPFSYRITMRDLSQYQQTVSQVMEIDGVASLTDRAELSNKLTGLRQFITSAGFWIILLLLIVSMFIISNTIRVTMYSRRLEISIMKSVGATDWFIRVPFVVEGLFIGLFSGLLTTGFLYFIYNSAIGSIEKTLGLGFTAIPYKSMLPELAAIFVSVGVIFGVLGGIISISRYLKGEGGDIIDW